MEGYINNIYGSYNQNGQLLGAQTGGVFNSTLGSNTNRGTGSTGGVTIIFKASDDVPTGPENYPGNMSKLLMRRVA